MDVDDCLLGISANLTIINKKSVLKAFLANDVILVYIVQDSILT